MKTNLILLSLIISGLIGCSKTDNSAMDNLTNKTWQLQTTGSKSETVVFSKDATYIITEQDQYLSDIYIVSATVKGLWEYDNGQITFKTAKVELADNNSTKPEVPVVGGQSIAGFYGIGSNLSSDSMINKNYTPAIWTIQELTSNKLTVEYNKATLTYNKK